MYTREAHPGEHLPAHRSFDDKLAAATRLREEIGIAREILVDDLEGSVHTAFGSAPNMTYVLGTRGIVLYKALWTTAERVEEFCERIGPDAFGKHRPPLAYTEQVELRGSTVGPEFMAGLARNGPRAVTEFERAMAIWTERAREAAKERRR